MAKLLLATRYGLFAVAAVLVNLLTQELSIQLYDAAYGIYTAMLAGTLTGLICKYQLDKHYIFRNQTASRGEDAQRFFIYGLTGVFTTLIFWAFELGFAFAFTTKTARYLGAVIGLSLGYAIKYRLDKHFVFKQQQL